MASRIKTLVKERTLWVYILPGLFALLLASVIVWWMYARLYFENRMAAFLGAQAVIADEIKIDGFGRYTLKNVKIAQPVAGDATIEEVYGQLLPFVDTFNLKARNIQFDSASTQVFIPQLEVENAQIHPVSMSEEDKMPSLSDILSGITARGVVIPEVFVRQTVYIYGQEPFRQDMAYRDIRFEDVANGRITLLTAQSINQKIVDDVQPIGDSSALSADLTAGPFELRDINMAFVADLCFAGPEAEKDSNDYQQLNGPYSLKNIAYQHELSDNNVMKFTIDEVSGTGFSMHPLAFSLSGFYDRLGQNVEDDEAKQERLVEVNDFFIEVLKAVGPFDMEIKGVTHGMAANTETHFDKARFNYNGKTTDFVLDNFHFINGDTRTVLENLVLDRVRFPLLFDTLKEASGQLREGKSIGKMDSELVMRMVYALIPRFDSVQLNGLSVDKAEQGEPAHLMGMEKLNINAENTRGAIPTSLLVSVSKLQLPITFFEGNGFNLAAARNSYLKTLGYGDYIDSNITLDVKWDEAKQQIILNEFSSDIVDFSSFKFWGTIGNVTETFFIDNPLAMGISAAGFRIKDFHLNTDKDGVWQRIILQKAEQTGKTPEEIRSERVIFIHNYLLDKVAIDNSETVKSLEPVFDYLNAGGVLTVDAVAKNPTGVGVYEFAYDPSDPYRWLNYFNFRANRQTATRKN